MNTYWIVWTFIAIAAFAVGERYAFKHRYRQNTLSMAIATLGEKWPLSIFIMGLFVGILAAHFFWPWAANPLGPGGG